VIQNFIAKLSPQEKKIFYITVAFVLLALFDRLFLGPVSSKLRQLDKEIDQENNVIKRNLRFLSYKDRILDENKSFSNYLPEKMQTEEEIIASFLKKIENLATEAKINLVKVTPNDTQQKKGYIEYYADVECNGPLDRMVNFIHSVDSSEDLVKIVKIMVLPQRASASEVSSTMVVKKILIVSDTTEENKRIEKKLKDSSSPPVPVQDESPETSKEDKSKEKETGPSAEVKGPIVSGSSKTKEGSSSDKELGSSSMAGGMAGDPSKPPSDSNLKTTQGSPPVEGGTSRSTRYQMTGGKSSGKEEDPKQNKNQEEEAPLKQSIWEKILGKQGISTTGEDDEEETE